MLSIAVVEIKPNSTTPFLDLYISLTALLNHGLCSRTEVQLYTIDPQATSVAPRSACLHACLHACLFPGKLTGHAVILLGIDKPPGLTHFSKQGLFHITHMLRQACSTPVAL